MEEHKAAEQQIAQQQQVQQQQGPQQFHSEADASTPPPTDVVVASSAALGKWTSLGEPGGGAQESSGGTNSSVDKHNESVIPSSVGVSQRPSTPTNSGSTTEESNPHVFFDSEEDDSFFIDIKPLHLFLILFAMGLHMVLFKPIVSGVAHRQAFKKLEATKTKISALSTKLEKMNNDYLVNTSWICNEAETRNLCDKS